MRMMLRIFAVSVMGAAVLLSSPRHAHASTCITGCCYCDNTGATCGTIIGSGTCATSVPPGCQGDLVGCADDDSYDCPNGGAYVQCTF